MSNSLIPYSSSSVVSQNKQAFEKFISVMKELNSTLSETDIFLIKQSMERHYVTVDQLNTAIVQAYEDPERMGKMQWNHIFKHLPQSRKNDEPKMPLYG